MKQKKKFNDKKAINALSSTNFSNLKKVENTIGFSESLISKNNKKKIPFFHLGPKNDWKEILNKDFQNKINKIFKKNLKDLEYL